MQAIIESFRYVRGVPQDKDKKTQSLKKLREISISHIPKVLLSLKVIDSPETFQHNIYWLLGQRSKGRSIDEKYAREICTQLIGEQVEVKRDAKGQFYASADSMEELVLSKL